MNFSKLRDRLVSFLIIQGLSSKLFLFLYVSIGATEFVCLFGFLSPIILSCPYFMNASAVGIVSACVFIPPIN